MTYRARCARRREITSAKVASRCAFATELLSFVDCDPDAFAGLDPFVEEIAKALLAPVLLPSHVLVWNVALSEAARHGIERRVAEAYGVP